MVVMPTSREVCFKEKVLRSIQQGEIGGPGPYVLPAGRPYGIHNRKFVRTFRSCAETRHRTKKSNVDDLGVVVLLFWVLLLTPNCFDALQKSVKWSRCEVNRMFVENHAHLVIPIGCCAMFLNEGFVQYQMATWPFHSTQDHVTILTSEIVWPLSACTSLEEAYLLIWLKTLQESKVQKTKTRTKAPVFFYIVY